MTSNGASGPLAARRLGLLAERLVHLNRRRMSRELLDEIIVTLRDGEKTILDLHQEIRVLKLPPGKSDEPQQPMHMQTLPYERLDSEALQRAVLLRPGEHLLVLRPYGWHLDGHHIPNAAEHFSRVGVCEELRMVFVCDYGPYIAIVRAAGPDIAPESR